MLLWMWLLNVWDNVSMDLTFSHTNIFNLCFKYIFKHRNWTPVQNIQYYTFIACWWGKYENVFTHEYHIPWGQRPKGIWYSWVNTFSYFLKPHAINVLLYRMKPRKHIHVHVKYCWQAYSRVNTLSYFPHQHALNVYYYTSYINNHKYINLIGQWVKIRTRDHTVQKSYSVK
jgi:hypothetical protein